MIDPLRHLTVFNPDSFHDRIDVIGCGATGSRITVSLAKLGITNLHVWDFDDVAEHNIANQMFGNEQIGMKKVDAIYDIIKNQTGMEIVKHDEKVDGTQSIGPFIFLLTDTMESRKEIWEKSIKFNMMNKLMIETRMGADNGRIYSVHTSNPSHWEAWEETLYSDEEAEVSACGASTSVGPTAEIISGLAVWEFIKYVNFWQNGGEDQGSNETIFSLRPFITMTRSF